MKVFYLFIKLPNETKMESVNVKVIYLFIKVPNETKMETLTSRQIMYCINKQMRYDKHKHEQEQV